MIAPLPAHATDSPVAPISDVFVDVSRLHHDAASNGDTWDYIWADDDQVYSFACDGRGYGRVSRNVNFNKLTGDRWTALTGACVNPLDDYGGGGQSWSNGSNWKATGGDCIDGVLYGFIANNWYGFQKAFGGSYPDANLRQTVNNMSLIKSTDKGLSWSRGLRDNYEKPMWTSRKFSTAFFFKYGRNGGSTTQDDQNKFVYAISNDGYWNCGSAFYLGRVLRAKIADLNPTDWQYFSNGKWSSNVEDASPIPGLPNGQMKCGSGSPIWLAALQKYVTVTWYDPGTTTKWHYPENVTFAFYQADHPWGPWSHIGESSCCDFIGDRKSRISRWYGPSLSPKFITCQPDGGVTAILTFSGQLWDDSPGSLYKNNACPVTFLTKAQPKEVRNFNDTEAHYSPKWIHQTNRGFGDYMDDIHVTSTPGEYVDFAFTGRGVEVFSEKYNDMGVVEVLIDGVSQGTFSLYQEPMPRLYQVVFYRNMNLPDGPHTLRILNKAPSPAFCIIDGFRVYRGMDFDPGTHYRVINRVNRHLLTSPAGDGHLRLAAAGESLNTQWSIRADGHGLYTIANVGDGKLLSGDPTIANTFPLQPSTDNSPATLWKIVPVGNGTFSITNHSSGMTISVQDNAAINDAAIPSLYFGRDIHKWEIVRVP